MSSGGRAKPLSVQPIQKKPLQQRHELHDSADMWSDVSTSSSRSLPHSSPLASKVSPPLTRKAPAPPPPKPPEVDIFAEMGISAVPRKPSSSLATPHAPAVGSHLKQQMPTPANRAPGVPATKPSKARLSGLGAKPLPPDDDVDDLLGDGRDEWDDDADLDDLLDD